MFTVTLQSIGNPDFHEPAIKSEAISVKASSLDDASAICRKYISENDLGGGNWMGGQVYQDGIQVAQISFNGRIWNV